jgi:signal transduction histidine kinase
VTGVSAGEPVAGGDAVVDPVWRLLVADAVRDGLSALERVLTSTEDGITLVGPDRRFAYANPTACEMLGRPLDELQGLDFLHSLAIPTQNGASLLPDLLGQSGVPFTCVVGGADGGEREIVCSTFAVELTGAPHWVAIFRDLSGPRAAARTALALAQTAAQPVGAITEVALSGIARHAVEGTRALVAGIVVVGDDRKLSAVGGGGFPDRPAALTLWSAASVTIGDLPFGDALLRNRPVVLPNARTEWEADPRMAAFAATLAGVDWQAVVYVPVSWEDQVLGLLVIYLPSGLDAPSEVELAVYTALAGQAAAAVTNARAATSVERSRLARDLHDSVSQALFSMTLHARAAQRSMAEAGVDLDGPVGRSIADLGELTRGALAEMRALIFELRPAALVEEGLVVALRMQATALTAREGLAVTVDGPEKRLELGAETEEHLYRIVLEALHNVDKHARATRAEVRVIAQDEVLRVAVSDDGAGFDQAVKRAGHLGLATMAGRAQAIGAELTVTSAPGAGTTVALVLPNHLRPPRKAARRVR